MSSPVEPLPRTSPEHVGIAPSAVQAFVDAVEAAVGGLHSFMLLRHGRVAAEGWWAPYAPERPHSLFSLSKSLVSTAVGLAVSEGLLAIDDPVVSFFPDKLPAHVSENLRAMRVRHLLSMSTGHAEDATGPMTGAEDGDWVRAFLALPVDLAPGTTFVYNSAATYMCSAILQELTGQTVLDYLTPRLFEPLGIISPAWECCPRGINVGGWGLSITTEDIARFGQCYLREGCWEGRQVVPAAWVHEATSKQIGNGEAEDSDWTQGYGFQFWRCRHNGYRGDGAFGQFCVVLPEQDAVLAITSGVRDMAAVLNAAWDHLLPGMEGALPAEGDDTGLRERLAGLAIPVPEGSAATDTARRVSGRTYRMDSNDEGVETLAFAFSPEGATVTMRDGTGEQRIAGGYGAWVEGTLPGPGGLLRSGAPPVGKILARGAWTDSETYTMSICFVESPFIETVSCRFSGDGCTIARAMNTGFGPAERPNLSGRASG